MCAVAPRSAFDEQLAHLQRDMLRMAVFVGEAIEKAVQSLQKADRNLARAVVDGDEVADRMAIDLQQRCLQLMALQQPMARDLRAVGTVLKVVTDLERMADHATDIAKVVLRLERPVPQGLLFDIPLLARRVQEMNREALDAWVQGDSDRARRMTRRDDEIDRLYRKVFDDLLQAMQSDPKAVRPAVYLLLVAHYLERIGDHATNLGEWTIYQETGELQDLNG
ncbi:PhoU-family transcriptional regulator [Symbiobacterium thermophilum IAM 14863]|uniref:Phosphate-specific transport system accessory protein PhoU n=1 Tax=Symbiobacterium thermophilum (strain DSM 24528 / JCM 14929 / IAM 14863 / T) TaxID=292459 RepID=Q67RG3_SYMTH|nr:PhoU-family transcriptional regulator [Symbiobacterium thermophilum IAM 14863]